jgi:hypothetical protein
VPQRNFMKAYTEILSGIIRAGPECDAYGKPFDFAVAFSAHACVATIKGLVQPGTIRLTRAHLEAMRQECERLGLEYIWERHKDT